MPRPVRKKVNTTAPTAVPLSKVLSAVPTHISSPRSQATVSSDDSDGLVFHVRNRPNSSGIPREDHFMRGALDGEPTGARQRPIRGAERAALSKIVRQADQERALAALKKRKEEADARAKQAEGTSAVARQHEVQVPSSPRPAERQRERRSLLRSSSAAGNQRLPQAMAIPAPATVQKEKTARVPARAQATPTSVLSLAKFKRRPRESSILRIGPDEDSLSLSLGGDFDGNRETSGRVHSAQCSQHTNAAQGATSSYPQRNPNLVAPQQVRKRPSEAQDHASRSSRCPLSVTDLRSAHRSRRPAASGPPTTRRRVRS